MLEAVREEFGPYGPAVVALCACLALWLARWALEPGAGGSPVLDPETRARRSEELRRVREKQQALHDEAAVAARADSKAREARLREQREAERYRKELDSPRTTLAPTAQAQDRPARNWGADRRRPRGG